MLGISSHILAGWEDADKASKKTLQGKTRKFSDEQLAFIAAQYKTYCDGRKKIKMTAFMKFINENWKKQSWLTPAPSRKTVTDILLANGCRKPEAQPVQPKSKRYYSPIKRYFPHVQSVLDGKDVVVQLGQNSYCFKLEFSKDMATDAICGSAVGQTENAALVKQAFDNHCQNYQRPLAALIDNGKGNLKAAIDLGAEGTIFIRAYPYRPQTKAQIEGEFGLFERKVSQIVIAGETEQERAMSVVKKIAEIYSRLRNTTPRCSNCPFTPSKLMKAKLDPLQEADAYRTLSKYQQDREKQKLKRQKINQELCDLIESIVKEHKLEGELLRFKNSMRWIEISTLKQAEQAFAAASQRDNFEPSKRTMAYFAAIARNMQHQKDQERKAKTARRRYELSQSAKEKREKFEAELKKRKQEQQLEKQPYLKITNAIICHSNLPKSFQATTMIFKNKMDQAILSIVKKQKQGRQRLLKKTDDAIMGLSQFSLNVRFEWRNYVNERFNFLLNNKAEVVTPI